MAKLNNSPAGIIKEINKSLRTIISQFYYPHLFFNESGLQCYFYAVFYRNKFFSISNLIGVRITPYPRYAQQILSAEKRRMRRMPRFLKER